MGGEGRGESHSVYCLLYMYMCIISHSVFCTLRWGSCTQKFLIFFFFNNSFVFCLVNCPMSCGAIVSLGLQAIGSRCEVLCQYMVVVHINVFTFCCSSGNWSLQNTVAHKCHPWALDSVLEMPPTQVSLFIISAHLKFQLGWSLPCGDIHECAFQCHL